MKYWIPILMMCSSAMAQNLNITNVPIAAGYSGSDTLLGVTNGHIASYSASAFVSSTNGFATNLTVNGTFSGNGLGLTNVYFTNAFWTYSTANTNTLYVSGAGEANANGAYPFKSASGLGFAVYTNANGQYGLTYDGNFNFAHPGIITNSAGSSRYVSDDIIISATSVSGTWSTDNGTAPAPTVSSGTNFFTNNISAAAPGLIVRTDTNFWVSGYLGNDSTFARGVGYAKTLGAVFARQDLTNGDVVVIWPGPVEKGTNIVLTVKTGMRVIGFGSDASRVVDTNTPATLFSLQDNCMISDFSIEQNLSGNSFGTPIFISGAKTNITVNRIKVRSFTDCVVLTANGGAKAQFNDCDFGNERSYGSQWDTYFDPTTSAGSGMIEFNRCTFGVLWSSNAWSSSFNSAKCLAVGGTPVRLNHCFLYMDGGASTNASCIRTITGNSNPRVELNSCILTNRGTGTNFAIINDGNGSAVLGTSYGQLMLKNTPIVTTNVYGTYTIFESYLASSQFPTNLTTSSIDITAPGGWILATNNVVQFTAISGVDITKTTVQKTWGYITNVAGSANPKAIIAPVNCRSNHITINGVGGIPFMTNVTRVTFECYAQKWTNMTTEALW